MVKFHDGNTSQIPDAHLCLIGLIITGSSSNEDTCRLAISLLLGAEHTKAYIATSGMQAKDLISMFRLLALDAFPKKAKRIQKTHKRLETAFKLRNQIAHANWHGLLNSLWNNGLITATKSGATYTKPTAPWLLGSVTTTSKQDYSAHTLKRRSLFIHGAGWDLLNLIEELGLVKLPQTPQSASS